MANQIAAGEVIQRPASVVKELVENAVDAGATEIHVLVTDAGKTCIQVVDNGKGMSETDARLSFERHATSKINQAADLFALRTMGFRGEALASIAAVAEVELKTRRAEDELGTRICIAGSKVTGQEPVACSKGSNFAVKNLFFNVPARRKFLKSNATELNNILAEFERLVLVNPDIAFHLYSNDVELFNLPASGMRQRILAVFGKKLDRELLEIKVDTTLVRLSGYVGQPDTARKKGSHQFFFANGRYMRHPYFHRAVMDAYEKLIPAGEQVSYFVYLDVDPAAIDINIHPTKTEIKFENEQAIWQILAAVVRESLGRFSAVPQIDFDTADMPFIPAAGPASESVRPPVVHYDPTFNPFRQAADHGRVARDWEKLYADLRRESSPPTSPDEPADDPASPTHEEAAPTTEQPSLGSLYDDTVGDDTGSRMLQYAGRFIICPVHSGILLIDQHRAHIRVLFQRCLQRVGEGHAASQGVLFPEIATFSPSEAAVLRGISDDLSAVGFDLSDLGGGSYAINGVPPGIEGQSAVGLLTDMVHTAIEKGTDVKEEVQQSLALALAKASAIPYGQPLMGPEMARLVRDLLACPAPAYTPDGLPVMSLIDDNDIERLFDR